jgi:hypothetical protein
MLKLARTRSELMSAKPSKSGLVLMRERRSPGDGLARGFDDDAFAPGSGATCVARGGILLLIATDTTARSLLAAAHAPATRDAHRKSECRSQPRVDSSLFHPAPHRASVVCLQSVRCAARVPYGSHSGGGASGSCDQLRSLKVTDAARREKRT